MTQLKIAQTNETNIDSVTGWRKFASEQILWIFVISNTRNKNETKQSYKMISEQMKKRNFL